MDNAIFAERLDTILRERRITQDKLGDIANVSPRHISRVKTGNATLTDDMLQKLASALDVPVAYFTGIQDSLAEQYFPVPLREAAVGMGGGAQVGSRRIVSYISLRKDFLLTKTSNLEALSFIHASGESMYPTIPPDAAVLIDESQREPVNKKIFYVMLNGALLIKRLEVREGRTVALISDNGEVREELGEQDQLEILGRALLQQTLL